MQPFVLVMRKLFILCFFILYNFCLLAQKDSTGRYREYMVFEVNYGYKTLTNSFDHNFNTINNFTLGKPLQTIGVRVNVANIPNTTEDKKTTTKTFFGNYDLYYNQIIPQPVYVNGIYKCNITGFVLGYGAGFDFFKKLKALHLIANFGLNTGRLRLYGNELTRQKNPFFAPKFGLQPRVIIGKLSISLTAEIDYDISKPEWRRTYFANTNKVNINTLLQTGFSTFFSVGYLIE